MSFVKRLRSPAVWFGCLTAAFAVTHIAALFTDAINWDEFALFSRAQRAVLTGQLGTGGRPGLGVITLIPFIADCRDHLATVHAIRIAWSCFTFALLAGLFCFLRRIARREPHAWHAAALGTALLALVPLFLRWSLQARTDQPAIAAALWAGVALLASRDRRMFALASGVLLGTGYLFSEKATYIGALIVLVSLGDLYIDGEFRWRRELARSALFGTGVLASIGIYKIVVPLIWVPQKQLSLDAGLDLFSWYRHVLGYRLYPSIVTSVIPHLVCAAIIIICAVESFRKGGAERKPLALALAVMLLGYGIARFHTASFPYFWITIGVFPATAIAIGWGSVRAVIPRFHTPLTIAAWVLLVALGVLYRRETLVDTQKTQRDTFALIEQRLPANWRGFQTDAALVCRTDPSPIRVYLGQTIQTELFQGTFEAKRQALIDEFRSRPIAFIIRTQRLNNFPDELREFWRDHYVPVASALEVAGKRVSGPRSTVDSIDVIVPGTYKWRAENRGAIRIDDRDVAAGGTLELSTGRHDIALRDDVVGGVLALDVPTNVPVATAPFYPTMSLVELSGVRRDWW
ncbi:MAG TPA: hypothetical protein VMZ53_24000 [Kofleriaceae bacterium]|nr:hypothetical protein [Kofleriaceae bacterium]